MSCPSLDFLWAQKKSVPATGYPLAVRDHMMATPASENVQLTALLAQMLYAELTVPSIKPKTRHSIGKSSIELDGRRILLVPLDCALKGLMLATPISAYEMFRVVVQKQFTAESGWFTYVPLSEFC